MELVHFNPARLVVLNASMTYFPNRCLYLYKWERSKIISALCIMKREGKCSLYYSGQMLFYLFSNQHAELVVLK